MAPISEFNALLELCDACIGKIRTDIEGCKTFQPGLFNTTDFSTLGFSTMKFLTPLQSVVKKSGVVIGVEKSFNPFEVHVTRC